LGFVTTYREINNRVRGFAALPLSCLSRLALKREIDRIGANQVADSRSASTAGGAGRYPGAAR
jgi:hypothetical protein